MSTSMYLVVMRASTCARLLPEGANITLKAAPSNYGVLNLSFRTRFVDEGVGERVPRELWIDARGAAPSLDAAISEFSKAAHDFAALIGVIANAAIGHLQVHIALDITPDRDEHGFLQNYLPDETSVLRPIRQVRSDLVSAVLLAVHQNPDSIRLRLAAVLYEFALCNLRGRQPIIPLNYLFIGMETLKSAALERERDILGGASNEELASRWGVPARRDGVVYISDLQAYVRRTILFQGDDDCHRRATEASDKFEHGSRSHDRIIRHAAETIDPTARYLRMAILTLSGIDKAVRDEVLAYPYSHPVSLSEYRMTIRGEFLGQLSDSLAVPHDYGEYPMLVGDDPLRMKSLVNTGDGRYIPNVGEPVLTLSVPDEKLTFRLRAWELHGEKADAPGEQVAPSEE